MVPAPSPAASSQLALDEVHIWCVSLDVPPETLARLDATLSLEERDRGARLRFTQDRQRFTVAHGALRDLLGLYLGIPPSRVGYVYNAFGKPALDPRCGRLRFNLSHSADIALIAIAAEADVGVDLEYILGQTDYAELARCFFSAAEVNALSALPPDRYAESVIGCWTKKEAYLKATGSGFAIPLNTFTVPLTIDPALDPVDFQVEPNDIDQTTSWSLYTLRPAPGYVGALAIQGSGWRLSQWQWKVPQH